MQQRDLRSRDHGALLRVTEAMMLKILTVMMLRHTQRM